LKAGKAVRGFELCFLINEGDSCRCKLTGILGIINIICALHTSIKSEAAPSSCDVITSSSFQYINPWFVPDPSIKFIDFVNSIWHLVKASLLPWTADLVQGHADKLARPVDPYGTLNCAATISWLKSPTPRFTTNTSTLKDGPCDTTMKRLPLLADTYIYHLSISGEKFSTGQQIVPLRAPAKTMPGAISSSGETVSVCLGKISAWQYTWSKVGWCKCVAVRHRAVPRNDCASAGTWVVALYVKVMFPRLASVTLATRGPVA
jgi:hypothetical protein